MKHERSSLEEAPATDSISTSEGFVYPGRELEAMAAASNYHRWILEIFKPYLGKHVVEVGAGAGSFSELILSEHACLTLALVEPSAERFKGLDGYARELNTTVRLDTYHATLTEAAALIKKRQPPDSIIYVNVLEHIANDEQEITAMRDLLSDGGRILIFVPALSWLYGTFDQQVGHVRRYTKSELEGKLRRAGFKILLSTYFDFAGIVPWWVKYRLLKSDSMELGAVRFYDRFIVPAIRRIESFVPPPIGKNLIVIAEK